MSSILNPIERLGTAEVDDEEEEIGADCVGGCCGCCGAMLVTDVDVIWWGEGTDRFVGICGDEINGGETINCGRADEGGEWSSALESLLIIGGGIINSSDDGFKCEWFWCSP